MKTLLVVALITLLAFFAQAQKPPAIPQAFATEWHIIIAPFYGSQPIIQGNLAVNYPKNLGYGEVQDTGYTPYQFQTTLIGHPLNKTYVEGFSFLNIGRCWSIGELSEETFHYFPLSIPDYANFVANDTRSNAGIWTWNYKVYDFIPVVVTMSVRYTDGAVLFASIQNEEFFPFTFTWYSKNFNATAPPNSLFMTPPGPCPKPTTPFPEKTDSSEHHHIANRITSAFHSVEKSDNPEQDPIEKTVIFRLFKLFAESHKTMLKKPKVQSIIQSTLQTSRPTSNNNINAPTPPAIKPWFSASYELGYGILSRANHWTGDDYQVGYVSIDSTTNGAYLNIHDDAPRNVPYQFNLNVIASPLNGVNATNNYLYLTYGRCMLIGEESFVARVPFNIPEDAKLISTQSVDGVLANFWNFIGEVEGIPGNVTIATAVEKPGSKAVDVVFIQVEYGNIKPSGAYVKFTSFSDSKPNPATFTAPAGPCYPLIPSN